MRTENPDSLPLLRARGLCKSYTRVGRFTGRSVPIRALRGVDLEIRKGSTLALVGQSGSGKSTLARCLALLEKPDSGEIHFEEVEVSRLRGRPLAGLHRDIQLILQDSASALNPRLSALEIIEEPLLIQGIGTPGSRHRRVLELMDQVSLPSSLGSRRPLELSGGQRQRLAISRALALEPKLLILDEALTGLDLSVQGQLVNLLMDLQSARHLTFIFVSHDLNLVAHVADEVAVIHQGMFVEQSSAAGLFRNARHAVTRELLASMPSIASLGMQCGT